MDTLIEIQHKFNRELIGGVAQQFLNSPIISWDNGFIQGLTAICFIFAVIDLILKVNDRKSFGSGVLNLAFYMVILLSCYGVINPRQYINFDLPPEYDYTVQKQNTTANTISKEMGTNISSTNTQITLDRDIYNAMAYFFNSVAKKMKGNTQVTKTTGAKTDVQTVALQSTQYFLKQVQLAKISCVGYEGKSNYANCLGSFIPRDPPVTADGKFVSKTCRDAKTGAKIECRTGIEEVIEDGGKEKETGILGSITGGISNFISKNTGIDVVVTYIVATYTFFVQLFSDPVINIVFPILLWGLEFLRSVLSLLLLIGYGFSAAGMMFFIKFMLPLLLIPKFRGNVFSAYKLLLATALFGFVSELFIMFSTVLTLALREAAYNTIVPYMVGTPTTTPGDQLVFAANVGTLTVMVYIGIVSVLLIQIIALRKIPQTCVNLTNLSVSGFVKMGSELAGLGVNIGLALGAGAAAAPFLIGGGMAAAGALKIGAGAAGAVGGAAAGKGGIGALAAKGGIPGLAGKGIQSGAQQLVNVGTKAQRGGANIARKGANFFLDKDKAQGINQILSSGNDSNNNQGGGSGSSRTTVASLQSRGPIVKEGATQSSGSSSSETTTPPSSNEGSDVRTGTNNFMEGGSNNSATPTTVAGGGGVPSSNEGQKGVKSVQQARAEQLNNRAGYKKLMDGKFFSNSSRLGRFGNSLSKNLARAGMGTKMAYDLGSSLGAVAQQGVSGAAGGAMNVPTLGQISQGASGALKSTGNKIVNKTKDIAMDEDAMQKIDQWKKNIGLENDIDQLNSNKDLQASIERGLDREELSFDEEMELNQLRDSINAGMPQELDMDNATQEDIQKYEQAKEDYQNNLARAYSLANTRSFSSDEQASLVQSLADNENYNQYAQKRTKELTNQLNEQISRYKASGSTESATSIASLVSQGASGAALAGVGLQASRTNDTIFNNKVDNITSAQKELYENRDNLTQQEQRELINKINQNSDQVMLNKNLREQIVGQGTALKALEQSGRITKEQRLNLELIKSQGEINKTIEEIDNFVDNDSNQIVLGSEGNRVTIQFMSDGASYAILNEKGDVIGTDESDLQDVLRDRDDIYKKLENFERISNYIRENNDLFDNDRINSEIEEKLIKIASIADKNRF